MNIEKSVATKLFITGIQNLDPVQVFIDDVSAKQGRVTIVCFDQSWTYFWGSIGERTIAEFFSNCSVDYLAGKLGGGLKAEIVDIDAIERHAKAQVCKSRRERDIETAEARDLFDEIEYTSFDDPYGEPDLMYKIYGDEWWYSLPKKVNPDYEYLCRIISAAKEALALEQVTA
jgi:hypothetical protein